MKILLTSDWHLGKPLYAIKLLSEQARFFEETFLPMLSYLKPDAVVVAGDILDKPLPDQETLFFYEDLLARLSHFKIPFLFILGNHDSRRTALHKYFMELAGLYLADDLRFFLTPFTLQDSKGEVCHFYLLPYLPLYELFERVKVAGLTLALEELNYPGLIACLLARIELKKPAFLVSHFALEKGLFSGEEIQIRGLSPDYLLPEELFQDFDLLLLGHLHRPQNLRGKIWYPGAPLAYSFETFKEERGVYLLEVKGGELVSSEFIPLTPPYELRLLQGPFEDLFQLPPTQAYVKVVLEDETPVFNAYERLKERFPQLLCLEYGKKREIEAERPLEEAPIYEEISLDERALFKEFYEFLEEKEIDPKLWEVYHRYLEEFYKKEREGGRVCQ